MRSRKGMLRRRLSQVFGVIFTLVFTHTPARAQTPVARVHQLYAPMEEVVRRYPSLQQFLADPQGIEEYIRAFRSSELGASWRHEAWVDDNMRTIAAQLAGSLSHMPRSEMQGLWRIQQSDERVVESPQADVATVSWSATGKADWMERHAEIGRRQLRTWQWSNFHPF